MANTFADRHLQPLTNPRLDTTDSTSRLANKKVEKLKSVVLEKDASSSGSASNFQAVPPNTYAEYRGHMDSHASIGSRGYWTRKVGFLIRYLTAIILIGLPLAIPVILFSGDQELQDETAADRQYRNLVFYIFLWLLVTWLSTCFVNIFTHIFPYIFKFVASYVNSAHKKYWRVFRTMRLPVTLLACAIVGFISFTIVSSSSCPRFYIGLT